MLFNFGIQVYCQRESTWRLWRWHSKVGVAQEISSVAARRGFLELGSAALASAGLTGDTNAAGLWPGEIQQHHIGVLMQSFEDNFTTIWRDIEVANVEVGGEVAQLPLGAHL